MEEEHILISSFTSERFGILAAFGPLNQCAFISMQSDCVFGDDAKLLPLYRESWWLAKLGFSLNSCPYSLSLQLPLTSVTGNRVRWTEWPQTHVFGGSEGNFCNTRIDFYFLKLLKDSIISGIHLSSCVWLSLEGLAREDKEGGCLKDMLYGKVTSLNLDKILTKYPSLSNCQLCIG